MIDVISQIEERLDKPTSKGLATAVSRALRDGALVSGQRLPPVRTIAHELGLSPTTVGAAWALLARAGTIHTAGRRGTVVAAATSPRQGRYQQALERPIPFDLDLSTGVPDGDLLPSLDGALQNVRTAGTPHSYLDEPVLPDLLTVLTETWPYHPPALTVVDGAMDALDLVIRARLRFGDRVLVEHPTFPPLLDLLEAAGAEVAGVRLDEQGILPSELERAIATPAQALFLQPRAHNPTGLCTTDSRLKKLAEIIRGRDLLIVEDDSANGISTWPDVSFGKILPENTVHIRSYSKSYGPDLRLAALSGPGDIVASVHQLRQLGQGWSSRLLQQLLLNLLRNRRSRGEVATARSEYSRRRGIFVETLAAEGVQTVGNDGLNVWVPVLDGAAALMRLASAGIGAAPGRPFQVLPDEDSYIRVTSGLITEDIAGIARAVAAASRTGGWQGRVR